MDNCSISKRHLAKSVGAMNCFFGAAAYTFTSMDITAPVLEIARGIVQID